MKRLRSKATASFFLAALLSSPAWGSVPPQPGTINYIEGQAAINAQALSEQSVGSVKLAAGQSLSTEDGRVEILLTPGIFLRVGDHSSVQMVSDTIVTLQKGRAMIEVADIRPENNVRLNENGSSTQLLKPGLYDFDADRSQIRVFDGKVIVQASGRLIGVTRGHELNLNASVSSGKLKPSAFDGKKASSDDFYRWASLRSSYLAEANVDAARTYAGGSGWSPSAWYGDGWYWDASFEAYTFIPGDGIFFDPFGWGFYSPWFAFEAPYYGYGYGYGYGYAGGRYQHRFGSGYRPPLSAGNRASGFGGRAHSVGGGGMSGVRSGGGSGGVRASGVRGGGFGGGGVRGGSSGGGFHGGGGGGGFHGGGGGRR